MDLNPRIKFTVVVLLAILFAVVIASFLLDDILSRYRSDSAPRPNTQAPPGFTGPSGPPPNY